MRILLKVCFLSILTSCVYSQNTDTLYINYIAHAPFAYKEAGEMKGIEIELIREYATWIKIKKNMSVSLKYTVFTDYKSLYEQTRLKSRNSFGLASAIITQEKDQDVDFSLPYIKNVSFCITNGNVPDIKSKSASEVVTSLGSLTALSIKGTSLNRYVNEITRLYVPDLKTKFLNTELQILDEISKNVLTFGYIDAITFWNYLKNNPAKSLKMQRVLSQNKEEIGFILPKGCPHNPLFKEFFSEFKQSSAYGALLEKYLGAYMSHTVALK